MHDVITFGSATWDIFLRPKGYKVKKDKAFLTGKGVCFNLGSKAEIEEIGFSSGGGGTNSAATFIAQGFKTAFCGAIGKDIAGKEILRELKGLGIEARIVEKEKATNHSIVLDLPQERTILVYRGASELLSQKDIFWTKAKWFYLAPLSGKAAAITKDIINLALKEKIKIALNPGNSQLSMSNIRKIISKADILLLNQEEASLLTGIDFKKEKEIFKKIDEMCPGITIMTKGAEGSLVSDGKNLFSAGIIPVKVKDRTGAGDSFGSGFVSAFMKTGDVKYAVQLATANAASCLEVEGAKRGLLKKGENFKKVKIEKI